MNILNTIIFLGAGASKTQGAPLQNELFLEYFREFKDRKDANYNILEDFFSKTYNINVRDANLYPTFEEILGLLYTAQRNQLSFYYDIDKIKEAIIFSVGETLDKKMDQKTTYHERLIRNLGEINRLDEITFVTTNYDMLMDRAIHKNKLNIDYGIYSTDYFPESPEIPLYKIYGSLNWLYCDVCDEFYASSNDKSILKNMVDNKLRCEGCGNRYQILLVPPTYYKEITNYHLNYIYHCLNKKLYEVENLIFCGYSLPDADIYIKFIIKKAELYKKNPFNVFVLNNHENKNQYRKQWEKEKYNLFFKSPLRYEEISFEEFTENPKIAF